ncbi:hypothetical protein FDUTEX481_07864 [Tolypothrix sp. PCC 7601]|nr:hypothetical protein FDUTEX481_07864 [Tolypothrix sp. PCC 7601]
MLINLGFRTLMIYYLDCQSSAATRLSNFLLSKGNQGFLPK